MLELKRSDQGKAEGFRIQIKNLLGEKSAKALNIYTA